MLTSDGFELKPHKEDDRYSIGVSHPFIAAANELLNAGARLYAVDSTNRYKVVGYPLSIEERIRRTRPRVRKRLAQERRPATADCQWRLVSGLDSMGAHSNNPALDLNFLRLRLSGVQSDKFFDNWQGVLSAALYWAMTPCPTANAPCSAGRISAVVTRTIRRRG